MCVRLSMAGWRFFSPTLRLLATVALQELKRSVVSGQEAINIVVSDRPVLSQILELLKHCDQPGNLSLIFAQYLYGDGIVGHGRIQPYAHSFADRVGQTDFPFSTSVHDLNSQIIINQHIQSRLSSASCLLHFSPLKAYIN